MAIGWPLLGQWLAMGMPLAGHVTRILFLFCLGSFCNGLVIILLAGTHVFMLSSARMMVGITLSAGPLVGASP